MADLKIGLTVLLKDNYLKNLLIVKLNYTFDAEGFN